ncbi:hypothetical protein CGCF413_v010603 [Colletotrichum fructicola]|nr:hypothetical protein CGCF413_v010603 [Colletotrichum fructicola]
MWATGFVHFDTGLIRTDAPEGSRFRVYRVNHSATVPIDTRSSLANGSLLAERQAIYWFYQRRPSSPARSRSGNGRI